MASFQDYLDVFCLREETVIFGNTDGKHDEEGQVEAGADKDKRFYDVGEVLPAAAANILHEWCTYDSYNEPGNICRLDIGSEGL